MARRSAGVSRLITWTGFTVVFDSVFFNKDDKRRMKRRRKEHARQEFSCDHLRNRRSRLSTHPLLLTTIPTNSFQGVPWTLLPVFVILPTLRGEDTTSPKKTWMLSNLSGCLLQTPLPPPHKSHEFLNLRVEISRVQDLRRSPPLKAFKKSRNNSPIPWTIPHNSHTWRISSDETFRKGTKLLSLPRDYVRLRTINRRNCLSFSRGISSK